MKKSMMVICLGLLLIGGMVGSARANSANVGFFFDGIDLDTGTVEYDRTMLVILMGETIEELLQPEREYLADFSPSVDVSFGFDPAEGSVIDVVLQDSVKIAVLEDTSFEAINSETIGNLEFIDDLFSVSIDSNDLVVAWTAENRYFTLSEFQWADWVLDVKIREICPDVIPEPSTLLLLGVGLVGVIGIVKRKKYIMAMLAIIVLASLFCTLEEGRWQFIRRNAFCAAR